MRFETIPSSTIAQACLEVVAPTPGERAIDASPETMGRDIHFLIESARSDFAPVNVRPHQDTSELD
jgi:hypothetical protein